MAKPSTGSPSVASLRRRFVAFAYDYILIALYLIILFAIFVTLNYSEQYGIALRHLFSDPIYGESMGFLLLTLPVALYFALSESSEKEATWGKRKMRLRVTDTKGNPLTRKRSLARSAIKFAPWELSHAIIFRIPGGILGAGSTTPSSSFPPVLTGGFAVVWMLVILYVVSGFLSKKHQTVYDMIAGTQVVSN